MSRRPSSTVAWNWSSDGEVKIEFSARVAGSSFITYLPKRMFSKVNFPYDEIGHQIMDMDLDEELTNGYLAMTEGDMGLSRG